MTAFRHRHRFPIHPVLLPLLLCLAWGPPVLAVSDSAEGQVLTMTGLKQDRVRLEAEAIKFTGLKRHSVTVTRAAKQETDKKNEQ